MNVRIIVAGLAALLLSGCTDADWDRAMSYTGLGSSEQGEASRREQSEPPRGEQSEAPQPVTARNEVATAPLPADQAARPDSWCQQVAKSAADVAAGNGFDAATQRRRAESTYRQCIGSSSR